MDPMRHATYFDAVDIAACKREFPVGKAFEQRWRGAGAEQLRAHQEDHSARQLKRAWQLPFFLHGQEIPVDGAIHPMIVHATSGTTGKPQPLVFSPRTREVHKLVPARAYLMRGMPPGDAVRSMYGHGPTNGGHYIREAVIHHTAATFFPAGTGVGTPSVRQVDFMRDFGATVIAGFADYIKRLADVAREAGLVPGRDIPVRMVSGHLAKKDLPLRRIEGFLGRSDNMVKLRGINVFPQALSSLLAGMPGFNGEYLCELTRDAAGREELLVKVECTQERDAARTATYAALLKRKLGVEVGVELVDARALSALTGVETRQKPVRLLDKRPK